MAEQQDVIIVGAGPVGMRLAQYPYEFIFAPGRVTINQEAWMQTRTIWTDGRKHQEDPDPTYMCSSTRKPMLNRTSASS